MKKRSFEMLSGRGIPRSYEKQQMAEAYKNFLARYPEYVKTASLDDLRATEYRRLDERSQVYLDYTGGSLYAESQIEKHFHLLRSGVFGNPHSTSPTSTAMTGYIERTRQFVLSYFGTTSDDYVLVFTQNATGGLKLVGESFPFTRGSRLLLVFDNHNSVIGIREFAGAKGTAITYVPLLPTSLRLDRPQLVALLDRVDPARENLFAFPAQSNVSGVKHPLDLVTVAQERGWCVLLDAAAYVPTNALDLGKIRPDFVAVSFYKMFGYPTGLGALLIRKSAIGKLKRPWFAGGTVNFASVQGGCYVLAPGASGFEDGTLDFLSIPAIEIGLHHIQTIGMDLISERVRCLTGWTLAELLELRHENGRPLVRIYGPTSTEARGGTVTLNLYDPQGDLLDSRRIEELAGKAGISLRSGCFCNPGVGEASEGLTEGDMKAACALGREANFTSFMKLLQERGRNSRFHGLSQQLCGRVAFRGIYRQLPQPNPVCCWRHRVRCRGVLSYLKRLGREFFFF